MHGCDTGHERLDGLAVDFRDFHPRSKSSRGASARPTTPPVGFEYTRRLKSFGADLNFFSDAPEMTLMVRSWAELFPPRGGPGRFAEKSPNRPSAGGPWTCTAVPSLFSSDGPVCHAMKQIVQWDETAQIRLFGRSVSMSWSILLLYVGLLIFALLAMETLLILLVEPSLVQPILRGWLAEVLTGRESGIAVFLEGEVPLLLTMQYSAMQDLATSFIVFPLYVYLLNRYNDRDNLLMRLVRRTREKAQRHERRVQRQGPVYLFFFMLIPFLVNGPLIGLMVGRLVGIRMPVLVTIVVAATVVPAIAWTFFYNTLFRLTEQILPAAPTYITIGVVVLVVIIIVVGSAIEAVRDIKEKKKNHAH